MNKFIKAVLWCCLIVSLPLQAAFEHDPKLKWKTAETANFLIHYPERNSGSAVEVAEIVERVHPGITNKLNWVPKDKTHVVITDQYDDVNGAATPYPANTIWLRLTPPKEGGRLLDNHSNFLETLIVHEYLHIVHLDKVAGFPKFLRKVFGRFDMLAFAPFPNIYQPLWIIEGLATYNESLVEPHAGRGNSKYYRALMRNEVLTGVKSLKQVSHGTSEWPLGTSAYLYGVYFMKFLHKEYSEEQVVKWIEAHSNNFIPFRLNNSSESAFGKSLGQLWQEFTAYLEADFAAEIAQVNAATATNIKPLSTSGMFTGNPIVAANGDIFYIQNDLASQAKLTRIDAQTNKEISVAKVMGSEFDYHQESGFLFVETDIHSNTNVFNDLSVYDVKRFRKKKITKGKRYNAVTWHPNGKQIAAVSTINRQSKVDILDSNGQLIKTLWQGSEREAVSHMKWSPDGSYLLASVWQNGYWNINKMELSTGQWELITQTVNIELKPSFSLDGNSILFIADYDGIPNAYQFDIATGNTKQLTNLLTGAFAVQQKNESGELLLTVLNENGYDIYAADVLKTTVEAKSPKRLFVSKIKASSFQTSGDNEDKLNSSNYSGLRYMKPKGWFPFVNITENETEVGVSGYIADPLSHHNLGFAVGYDGENGSPVGGIAYVYDRWNPTFKLSYIKDSFILTDEDDEFEGFAKSEDLRAELVWPFLKRNRQLALHLAYLDTQEKTVNSTLSSQRSAFDFKDERIGAAISYNSAKRYLHSVSRKEGHQIKLVHEDGGGFDGVYDGNTTTLDIRSYFGVGRQSIFATRLLGGVSEGSVRRFRLGGNIDGYDLSTPYAAGFTSTDEVFGQRSYALRGYPTDVSSLRAKKIGLVEAEYRFPIKQFEGGSMSPPIGLNQMSGTVFYNAGSVWSESFENDQLRQGVGVELNTEIVLGYGLGLGTRLGLAHGLDDDGETQVYLNLGGTY